MRMWCLVREEPGERGAAVAPAAGRLSCLQIGHPGQDSAKLPGSGQPPLYTKNIKEVLEER
jgi:hypothetical protein